MARRTGAPILFVECRCADAEVRRRLRQRAQRNDDASDADWTVYQQQQRAYQPFETDEGTDHLPLDTAAAAEADLLAAIESRLRALAVRS